ncbi:MAG TPA: glycosyltransferase family 4 protein [Acidobacteriaceae bacterium]|nr:glycosyltransferase family 4 protein [Acidobacteriaceae bacterium]
MTGTPRRLNLTYLVSHPIQYQAPLLRRIALEPDIHLTTLFGSNRSVLGYRDRGFGTDVKWDVPLLEGYEHTFLPVLRAATTATKITRPMNYGILSHLRGGSTTQRADVLWVHGYAGVNAMHGLLAAKALGIPTLIRTDSTLTDRPRSASTRIAKSVFFAGLRRLVSGALSTGERNTAYWQHHLGSGFPIFPMPYAVDNDFFAAQSRAAAATRAQLQQELGLDPARPVILFASKLQTRKLCIDLLNAYIQLSPDGIIEPHPYLLIVGDGEERAALETRAARTGWKSIRFLGFRNQSELPRFFDLCAVFVLPSRHEPWGLVVNEVMNASRAVIVSSDVGCQNDLVTDGVNGCVYPVGEVNALAASLRRVLATPETYNAMGQHSFERIQHFSLEDDIRGLRRALAALTGKISA